VALLDLLGRRPEGVGEALLGPRLGAGKPGAELALLVAGELGDLVGIAGPLLHQGQGLEDRVVQMGGHLRPLLRTRPRHSLGRETANHRPPQRR
jgi:hypothetical protein